MESRIHKALQESGQSFGVWHSFPISRTNITIFKQKIRSTAYVSFSFLGLILIFVLGGLIVVVSFILEPLANFIHRRCRKAESYALIEWSTNETLQLQRLAHEELGLGTWSRAMKSVPITEADEVLGLLDLADPDHPRLQKPPHEEKPDEDALAAESEHLSGDNDGRKDSISSDEVHVSLQEESEVSDHQSSSMTSHCSEASPQVEISPYEAAFLWDPVAEGGSTVQRDVRP
ncbi:cytochrome p450 protein [Neofusicoccum parvum]|uniref:Cytochrome p450 protein n=1 Tax=Neofusicoccum parvum TaxID=310453 RepID=A0ACB5SHY6_9PEZI|nr:cytochrome p450 protein [Neofusicoccum parvum]